MAVSIIHTSFAAGEISPNLFARVDLDKYHVGAELMRNFFVDYRGGASTRPGTMLVDRTKFKDKKARLIPFVFSQDESYILEFGDLYIRFYFNGEQVVQAPKALTGITQSDPAVVTAVAHGYATGNDVFLSGIVGMTELNDGTYRITILSADTFSLEDLDGVAVDSSTFAAYVSGGTSERIYELVSPYLEAELSLIKFAQSADVMTLCQPNHGAYNLSRLSAENFQLAAIFYGPKMLAPGNPTATPTTAGGLTFGYVIVAGKDDGDRSVPSDAATCDSVSLDPTTAVISLAWDAVTDATVYFIYKWGPILAGNPLPTFFGFIGQTDALEFTDNNIAPDFSNGPPEFRNPFDNDRNPGCVAYFQQRRVYGNLVGSPEELDFSRTGTYDNFDVSVTVDDSDAIQIALAARQVNAIKSLVPMSSGLVVLTTGGAFQITGGAAQVAVTPTNITALPQASTGANDLPPIVVNYDILFVQNKGSIVRDLAYNFYLQTFYGFDRSALANHLFFGFQLQEWAWAEEPFKIVWAVRNDGRLLALTYVPEQEVYGWTRHDTYGSFESVASVPEGQEDAVYTIVQRPYHGDDRVRYVERMASRKWNRVEDVWCVDAGVALELERPDFGLNMTANTTTAFIQAATGTPFDSSWVGKIIWFDAGGKLVIDTITSVSQIVCTILQPLSNLIPDGSDTAYFEIMPGEWEVGPLVSELGGLSHLAGMTVQVLADGQSVGPLEVSAEGTITLLEPASKVLAGLGYICQLRTLYLDVGDPTVQGKRKKISAVTMRIDQARALSIGQDFEDMNLYFTQDYPFGASPTPIPLQTGDERVIINGDWNTGGQISVQQSYPFPATVLGLIPEVIFGDTQQ